MLEASAFVLIGCIRYLGVFLLLTSVGVELGIGVLTLTLTLVLTSVGVELGIGVRIIVDYPALIWMGHRDSGIDTPRTT